MITLMDGTGANDLGHPRPCECPYYCNKCGRVVFSVSLKNVRHHEPGVEFLAVCWDCAPKFGVEEDR